MDYSILLPGVPVSSARGALGWSTVSLIRHQQGLILVDTGSYGDRSNLLIALKEHDVSPDGISEVFITHLHYDHFLNAEIFSKARIWVPARDLQYVLDKEFVKANDPYVPETMVHQQLDRLNVYVEGDSIVSGCTAVSLPGHTHGTSGLLCEEEQTLFAGDGIKNAYEYVKNEAPPCFFDADVALSSYGKARSLADVIVPGHDCPFRSSESGTIEYLDCVDISIKYQSGRALKEKQIRIS